MRLWTHELSSPFASEHCSSRIVGRCLHVSSLLVPGLRDHDNHFKSCLSPLRGACERDRQRLLFGRAGRKGLSIMRVQLLLGLSTQYVVSIVTKAISGGNESCQFVLP
jgi:hypothetical protein